MKAIVTGHTRGLGAAIAEELMVRGIGVVGLARQRNAALAARHPELLAEVAIDLADSAALAFWLAGGELERRLRDCVAVLLINNAGTLQPLAQIGNQDVAAVARAVSLNVAAPLMLATALVSACPGAVDRRLLHISSGAGRSPYAGWSVYGATKAALDHHARAIAIEAPPGLRICSLAPGVIDTAMQAEIRASTLDAFPLRERFDALKRDGALADPRDCAHRLVDYLLDADFGREAVVDLRQLAS